MSENYKNDKSIYQKGQNAIEYLKGRNKRMSKAAGKRGTGNVMKGIKAMKAIKDK